MSFRDILNQINKDLEPLEFESHPFKVGWYNTYVDEKFKLNYAENTFGVLILNKPLMFDKHFLPFLFKNYKNNLEELESLNDPIDICMKQTFDSVKENLEYTFFNNSCVEIEKIHDYDMVPGARRPKIIMQTCAHIAGAAYYYDPKKIGNDLIKEDANQESLKKNLMGVCLHPKYGGWFALRCVLIFKNVLLNDEDMPKADPIDPLNGDLNKIINLLKKFNFNWRDWTYRDVISVSDSYSEIQREYFALEPKNRKELLIKWLSHPNHKHLCKSYLKQMKEEKLKNYLLKNFYLF